MKTIDCRSPFKGPFLGNTLSEHIVGGRKIFLMHAKSMTFLIKKSSVKVRKHLPSHLVVPKVFKDKKKYSRKKKFKNEI